MFGRRSASPWVKILVEVAKVGIPILIDVLTKGKPKGR
jgi:hypothetical protein